MDTPTTGYSLLAGGIILAIMVSPIIISVSMEVLRTVPIQARETALALGTTKWQAIKHVLLRSPLFMESSQRLFSDSHVPLGKPSLS